MASLFTFLFFMTGCPERRAPFFHTKTDPLEKEPDWVFEGNGPGRHVGEDVIQAVGVDSKAFAYGERLQNALKGARDRLESEIYAAALRMGEDIILNIDPPDDLLGTLYSILRQSAEKTGRRLAAEAVPVSTHESLLRREVFVKLVVPVRQINTYYRALVREELQIRLQDELDGEELEMILESFDLTAGILRPLF